MGPITSYMGDVTAWFEYVADEVGDWNIKFEFRGDHLPGINTTASMFSSAGYLPPVYYKPSSSPELTLTVQQDMVASWPPSELPTDYWTRPVSPENKWLSLATSHTTDSWWTRLKTRTLMQNYRFTPIRSGTRNCSRCLKRLGALSGLIEATWANLGWFR